MKPDNMRISQITVWQMDLPLRQPYFLSGGRLRFDRLDSTFVRIDTDAGLSGWGESCPWGHSYLPAHGPGVRAGLEILAPAVIGADPRCLDHVNRLMDVALPGHNYVKSAVDMACWDIFGRRLAYRSGNVSAAMKPRRWPSIPLSQPAHRMR